MTLRLPITALLLAALAAGCLKEEKLPLPADAGLDAGTESPDAGEPDAGGPPVPPRRALVPMHLLGATPVENLVHSPHFDMGTDLWFAFTGENYAELRRHVLPSTPADLPALEIVAAARPRILVGMARGGEAPLAAGVWIGHAPSASPRVTVTVYGLPKGEAEDRAFELQAEEGNERQTGEIVWRRYAARIDRELLGVGTLVVSAEGEGSVFVNGPTIARRLAQPMPGLRQPLVARMRTPTAGEAGAVRRALDELRQRHERPRDEIPQRRGDRW